MSIPLQIIIPALISLTALLVVLKARHSNTEVGKTPVKHTPPAGVHKIAPKSKKPTWCQRLQGMSTSDRARLKLRHRGSRMIVLSH
jgi:hypothetical protein